MTFPSANRPIVEGLQENIGYLHPIALGKKLKYNNVKNILAIQKKGKTELLLNSLRISMQKTF